MNLAISGCCHMPEIKKNIKSYIYLLKNYIFLRLFKIIRYIFFPYLYLIILIYFYTIIIILIFYNQPIPLLKN